MDKVTDLDEKTRKISMKLGALIVKELLINQYKLNALQRISVQSHAFNIWKSKYLSSKHEERSKSGLANKRDKKSSNLNSKMLKINIKTRGKSHHINKNGDIKRLEKMYINKNKLLTNSIKTQTLINISLQKDRNQKLIQVKLCKINIALKMFSCAVNEHLMPAKAKAFNMLKDHTLNGLRRQAQFNREFDLLQANDQSSIKEAPESLCDSEIEEIEASNPRDVPAIIHEELAESSESNHDAVSKKLTAAEELNRVFYTGDSSSEEDPANLEQDAAAFETRGEFQENNDEFPIEEESPFKRNGWVDGTSKKSSPFNKNRRRLIINTDSMDSGGIKNLKTNGDESTGSMMQKRRQNPPATLTTNATTHKHNEALFSQGIPSKSEDSKKIGEAKTLDKLGFDYYEFLQRQEEDQTRNEYWDEQDGLAGKGDIFDFQD